MDGMAAEQGVRVVSAVAGRIRLRATDRSSHAAMLEITEELGRWDAVTKVDVRAASRSVVVHFDPGAATAVADGLLSMGVDLRADATPAALAPGRDPSSAIRAAAVAADRAVGRRLDGTDLRVLVPLGLGLLAARRAMRGEDRLADAPWYVLAWYASETFSKLQAPAAAVQVAGGEAE